jgi:hypothetical protein
MESFKLITIEKTSKYGQYLDADTRFFEKIETKPRIIKTKDVVDIFLLSDYDLSEHKDDEITWVESMIKEGLNKYFYLKLKEPVRDYNFKLTDIILVFGNFMEFMNLMHTGGHLKSVD